MNIDRLQLKGLLAEAKKQHKNLEIEAAGLIILLRSLLNPYIPIEELEIDKAKVSTERLSVVVKELKTLQDKIKKLESEFE